MSGPLKGVKVVEFAGIGPGPFACMMLADMGAEVLRIDRAVNVGKEGAVEPKFNNLLRGRKNVAIDLKNPRCSFAGKRTSSSKDSAPA
jgi:alpha-methylacyl-CoA racemase